MTAKEIQKAHESAFESIRKTNEHGQDFWSARELAKILGYLEYRNFLPVIAKAKEACLNSKQRIEDHFVDVHEMVNIGSGQINLGTRDLILMKNSVNSCPNGGIIKMNLQRSLILQGLILCILVSLTGCEGPPRSAKLSKGQVFKSVGESPWDLTPKNCTTCK